MNKFSMFRCSAKKSKLSTRKKLIRMTSGLKIVSISLGRFVCVVHANDALYVKYERKET